MADDRDHRLLATYLNDHLLGATVGVELSARARDNNRGGELGTLLARLHTEIAEDRRTLQDVMRRLDVGVDRVKVIAGWTGEKLGRLKPNGRLFSYSPLSRVVELEALCVGIEGKRMMWASLAHELGDEPRVSGVDFTALERRAARQREELEPHRLEAVRLAIGRR